MDPEDEMTDSPDIDPAAEIQAMTGVHAAIKDLAPEARRRVLSWASSVFGDPVLSRKESDPRSSAADDSRRQRSDEPADEADEYGNLADLYSKASPSSQMEKVLVVSYWLQVVCGADDVDTQSVNAELKNLGYGIRNITRAFDKLSMTRPQLVIQTRKSGTSKQARKRFKVTVEGQRRVKEMLSEFPG